MKHARSMTPASRNALRKAFAVYLAWVAATYLLEGLPGTLLRPESVGLRLAYAGFANLVIGIVVPLWCIRNFVREELGKAEDFGFGGAGRTILAVVVGTGMGSAVFALSQSGPIDPLVVLNSFAQVWVVSLAEIVVCWALVGAAVFRALRSWSRPGAYLAAGTAASVLFGVYHFAHSAPFNQLPSVLFLTGIGFVTSVWWFVSRDVYGTAIFHSFFGVTGVLAALQAGGFAPPHPQLSIPLAATAAAVTLILVVLDLTWVRLSRTL
jgi:hypothetical protein